MRRTRLAFLLTLALALGAARGAHAEGTVIAIDGDDIYVDVGAAQGVGPRTSLTLLHVIVARDPVSGKTLRDRFPLGTLTVVKSGERVSVAQAPEDIRHRVKVGDEIALASKPREFKDPWQETIDTRRQEREARAQQVSATARGADPRKARENALARALATIAAAELVRDTWQRTLGRPPAERIEIWQAYLQAEPASPYAERVREEIASMDAQMQAEAQVAEQVVDPTSRRAELRAARLAVLEPYAALDGPLAVSAPASVYEGTPVGLVFTVLDPQAVSRAWLYYRRRGSDGFRRVQLEPDGDAYMRGTIPAEAVGRPGIEYFVEVASADPDQAPAPVIGHQNTPRRIAVQATVEEREPDIRDRSRITMFMDYVDFDGGLGRGFDQYLHAEIDFMYRFFKPVYAMRVGFGTIGGMGGPKDWISQYPGTCTSPEGEYRCRRVTFSYAYTELEYRFSPIVALMLRPQFGTGTTDERRDSSSGRCQTGDTSQCEFFAAFGLRGRLRLGDERRTNLTLGVGMTQNVGTVFEAAFTWSVIPQFPVMLSAQVTDQPVPEDIGVRLIADVGWRALSWVYPSLRVAYQARDVNHTGVSGGVAVTFDW